MGNLLTESIAAFTSILVCLIAYISFGPIINDVLQTVVLNALSGYPTDSALALNANSLLLTSNMIVMGIKVFSWLVIFAAITRLFLYVGFKTETIGAP
jgi:hypothetical protein